MSGHQGFLCVLALLATLGGCKEEAEAPPIRPVLSVKAEARSIETLGPYAGSIQPRYSTDFSFRIFGRMVARMVNIGSAVKQGDEIAALDPAVQALLVRNAEAAVASAKAQLANARAEEGRQRTLAEHNITPQSQYDVVIQNRETAAANLACASASLRRAEDALSFTQLRADFDGVVTAAPLEAGQVVNPGQKVVTIARPDVREAVISVPSALADLLSGSETFDIDVQLDPSVTMKAAAVRSVDPTADPITRTRQVFLTLNDPPPAFRLGITISVTLSKKVPPRIELPASALLERDGKKQVWIVDPATSKVSLREVGIGGSRDGTIAVTSGIAVGERVVTVGVNSLTPGQAVKIAEIDTAAGGPRRAAK